MRYKMLSALVVGGLVAGSVGASVYADAPQRHNNKIATSGATMSENKLSSSEAGKQFLAKNAERPGVKMLADGLQYEVLKEGHGETPSPRDTIVVNYEGSTIDGKVFDSSFKRGESMTAPLRYMIPGWVEAVQRMKAGSTWMLYIPADLAYGEHGAPPVIGPNETLIFKVELIDVKKA